MSPNDDKVSAAPKRTGLAILVVFLLIGGVQFLYQFVATPILEMMASSLKSPILPWLVSIGLNGAGAFVAFLIAYKWFRNADRQTILYSAVTGFIALLSVAVLLSAVLDGTSYAIGAGITQLLNVLVIFIGGKLAILADKET